MNTLQSFFLHNGIGQNIVAWIICGGLGFTAGTLWARTKVLPGVKHHLSLLTELHQHHLPDSWEWLDGDDPEERPTQ